ncbi:amidohydrolase family protein [Streptomyces sp. NPDC096012]|uniref:amidohydrolase family protein n=1 Tax=Streptomyces sp. NPDC096012 TaxID=3155684 RepID=UPI00336ABAFA
MVATRWRAVAAIEPGGAGPVFLPDERPGLRDPLTAYTAESAYVNHLDDAGRVAAGALADLVVLDRDPFTQPPEALAETAVALTHVGGERVFATE